MKYVPCEGVSLVWCNRCILFVFLIHVRPYLQLSRADLRRRLDGGAVLRLPVVILSPEFFEIIIISWSRENKTSRRQKKSSCVIS